MNKSLILHSRFTKWTSTLLLTVLALALCQESAQARRYRIVLPDGVECVFDVEGPQATITLSGTSKNSYQIEGSEDLLQWTTLRNRALLDNNGTFTYVDNRGLPKCFYRIAINKGESAPSTSP
ncbi:MAG: hypothetical protein L0Y58_13495 [Verrucomicrobia subdivision 3 bacterium]|nr:hypothetical protein [Limisphaerales bacterium]